MPLETGVRVEPYLIEAAIGAGGMGDVYRARDTRLRRDVAVKGKAGVATAARQRSRDDLRPRAIVTVFVRV